MTDPAGTGVELARVVAVVAVLSDGSYQVGTGYLITGRLVLTAEHCTRDKSKRGLSVNRLRVIRASDQVQATGVEVAAATPAPGEGEGLDLAVLRLEDAPWDEALPAPVYARVNRAYSGMLKDCQAIGYPFFQYAGAGLRDTAELHGTIYQTELASSGRLVLREPLLSTVTAPPLEDSDTADQSSASAWGGLSGAVVFHHGCAVGVVIEHHPRQGTSAVQLAAFDQLLETTNSSTAASVALTLGLSPGSTLPVAAAQPVVPLAELVDIVIDGDLPRVDELDPYRLGATPSDYGDRFNHGSTDPYVLRTYHDVDARLETSLAAGRFALLTGPSKAGKSRTAFEVLRRHWPVAYLVAPQTTVSWEELAEHPRLRTSDDPVIVWMDDIHRFLTGNNQLTPGRMTALTARPGHTVLLGTLRTDRLTELRDDTGELSRDTRLLLESATTIALTSTRHDPQEQAAARAAYPGQPLGESGLGEELAHAPQLLQKYRESREGQNPLRYLIVRCAVDWARSGVDRPIPEPDLKALAKAIAWLERPDLDITDTQLAEDLGWARTSLPGASPAALLVTHCLPGEVRGYRPFDYLAAADEGQHDDPRPIPDAFWAEVLARSTPDDAADVATSAYYRDAITPAVDAFGKAASNGSVVAMTNLGVLLANRLDPPDLIGARTWYTKAADKGHTDAMHNLGILLANRLDPPDLDSARTWWEKAADNGDTDAMHNLGNLLADRLDPPDLDSARTWYTKAADNGDTDAMNNLGLLCLRQFDVLGAVAAWKPILDQGPSDEAANAAINLAPILAVIGQVDDAVAALTIAQASGITHAADYASALATDPSVHDTALIRLATLERTNTDVLNFLGMAAQSDGRTKEAQKFWISSQEQGDVAAPVMLHLTSTDNPLS